MSWMNLSYFLLVLPIIEYLGMYVYTYIRDSQTFMVELKAAPFTLTSLVLYQWMTYIFVKGLICPSDVEKTWIPIIIFGINAFIYTIYMFIYLFFFSWIDSAKKNTLKSLTQPIVLPTILPTTSVTPMSSSARSASAGSVVSTTASK